MPCVAILDEKLIESNPESKTIVKKEGSKKRFKKEGSKGIKDIMVRKKEVAVSKVRWTIYI